LTKLASGQQIGLPDRGENIMEDNQAQVAGILVRLVKHIRLTTLRYIVSITSNLTHLAISSGLIFLIQVKPILGYVPQISMGLPNITVISDPSAAKKFKVCKTSR
jgi:hypothetical protein